ncbi:hypothetical protein [Methylobacterium durans]|uniref:Uncharacterized protein n=1 Tax=Methylobacterium durans TaxID=2202825 RepID=A0A2U8WE24_9HYPH|nr:hypothetical protein [Methylobacterium durans]AWN43522.1 hypothetical protein DK389_27190 [Methylobacterium durans]
MRILRLLPIGAAFAACTGIIGFACADRLAHPRAAPAPILVRAAPPEPSATGSILPAPTMVPPPQAAPKATPRIPNGFDTERLHALMRGDPIAPQKR